MMSDGYQLLVKDKVAWPYELNKAQKVELLETALSYFQEIEDYKKCAVLKKKIENVNTIPKRGKPKGSKNKISYDKKQNQDWNRC